MYAAILSYRVLDLEAFVQKIEEEFVDRVRTVAGFVSYSIVGVENGTVVTVSVAETREAVEAATEQAADWVVEKAAHLVEGAPAVTTGEVRVRVDLQRSR